MIYGIGNVLFSSFNGQDLLVTSGSDNIRPFLVSAKIAMHEPIH